MEGWGQEGLQWENWKPLLKELVFFTEAQIRRRWWRGSHQGVLPEGFDANSVAAEVVLKVLTGRSRLALGWNTEGLVEELKRLVSNEVRRLNSLMEALLMRNEWDVLPPDEEGQLRSIFDQMQAANSGNERLAKELDAADERDRQKIESN